MEWKELLNLQVSFVRWQKLSCLSSNLERNISSGSINRFQSDRNFSKSPSWATRNRFSIAFKLFSNIYLGCFVDSTNKLLIITHLILIFFPLFPPSKDVHSRDSCLFKFIGWQRWNDNLHFSEARRTSPFNHNCLFTKLEIWGVIS